MPIVFAGAAAYEFGNVTSLSDVMGTYESDYALGSISKTNTQGYASAIFDTDSETRVWCHVKAYLVNAIGGSYPIISLHDTNGAFLCGLTQVANQGFNLSVHSTLQGNIVQGGITVDELIDIDMALYAFGSNRVMELFIDGVLIGRHSLAMAWVQPAELRLRGGNTTANTFSEIIVTAGDEPTLGWRLHSKRPDPSLPGLNSFDSGYWGSLGNDSQADGVVTTASGARVTGGFLAYTGPAEPMGIRGIMVSGRYLKNGSDLGIRGQLRISDTNYDTPTREYIDQNRIMSYWEENPDTEEPFVVADFAGMQGGFRTVVDT